MTLSEEQYNFLRKVDFENIAVVLSKEVLKDQLDIKHDSYGIGVCKAGLIPMVFMARTDLYSDQPIEERKVLAWRFNRGTMALDDLNTSANKHKEYYQIMGTLPKGE